ncbi:MAG: glutamate synthase subunit beta [Bacteroidetes bacterium]|nr:glutamate synthase subunit beta [Bacteroidota bacterium]
MGDIKGFLKYKRALPEKEAPDKRTRHFEEFEKEPGIEFQQKQASRCMSCGVPFCHSGCPLGNLIPDFNDAVYKNDWRKAYDLLVSTNNFPEFTGRICPAPCEASCVLSINNDPVTIESVEKSIIERAFREGWVKPRIPAFQTDKKVAVVGSGPAGLAAADQLNQAGHRVTVFEKSDRAGGLLRYGIPDFKLSKKIIDRRIEILEAEGIRFMLRAGVGTDIPAQALLDQYDAVVLCGGSSVARDLPIKGRAFSGIHFAMEYLEQSNRRVAGDNLPTENEIEVKDKNVIVIGGGDTGSDCIGTSNRLGAATVTQLEILGKPPVNRKIHNPWPLWPMTLRTSSSQEEGCTREWAVLTKEFLSENGKDLSGIKVVEVHWGENGKMQEMEGTERILPAERIFLAMGFLHPPKKGMLEQFGLKLDNRGNVAANNFQTSVEKVFAAGDMHTGQSLVVKAIAQGREAAIQVDGFLHEKEASVLLSNECGVLSL